MTYVYPEAIGLKEAIKDKKSFSRDYGSITITGKDNSEIKGNKGLVEYIVECKDKDKEINSHLQIMALFVSDRCYIAKYAPLERIQENRQNEKDYLHFLDKFTHVLHEINYKRCDIDGNEIEILNKILNKTPFN